MNIQNHFADPALLSLAELKARLEQDMQPECAQTARDDICHQHNREVAKPS